MRKGLMESQFLHDNINDRTDEYGGNIENRSRFPLQVVKTVIDAVGANRVNCHPCTPPLIPGWYPTFPIWSLPGNQRLQSRSSLVILLPTTSSSELGVRSHN